MRFIKIISTISMLLTSGQLFAYELREMPINELMEKSDMIAIGTVKTINPRKETDRFKIASIKINRILKGDKKSYVFFLYDGPISEAHPKCCDLGEKYLFFLIKVKDENYVSTNGRYAVLRLAKDTE